MTELKLDQLVKGTPPPDVTASDVAIAALPASAPSEHAAELLESKKPASAPALSDPLSTLPSSPPQIYLNLLILEASLRSQYLALNARRRQHTFFLTLLGIWVTWFFYAVFLRVREDGKGLGGSVYWVVDMGEKVAFMGGLLTAVLIWATGQWERGLRWPRRWVGTTNRGLRGMNLKIVILRGPWWMQPFSYFAHFFPYSTFFPTQASSYQLVESTEKRMSTISKHGYKEGGFVTGMREEDVAPGGDRVKLLLLPKAFSPEFRENWDTYRTNYWERENERRADLRKSIKEKGREDAKKHAGWLWWTGWRGFRGAKKLAIDADAVKRALGPRSRQPKDARRPKAISNASNTSVAKTSIRSNTMSVPEVDESVDSTERRRLHKTNSTAAVSTRSAKSPTRKSISEEHTGSSNAPGRLSRRTTSSSMDYTIKEGESSDPGKFTRVLRSTDESKPQRTKVRQRDIVGDSGED